MVAVDYEFERAASIVTVSLHSQAKRRRLSSLLVASGGQTELVYHDDAADSAHLLSILSATRKWSAVVG